MKPADRALCFWRFLLLRCLYSRTLRRLRRDSKKRKLRVVFLVSELAKWKSQRVFDRMRASDFLEPIVAVANLTRLAKLPIAEQKRRAEEMVAYFEQRGMSVVNIQKYGTKHTLSVKDIKTDILVYQQPWDLSNEMLPWRVAWHALTLYIPYYTPSFRVTNIEIGRKVHRAFFAQIVCNKATTRRYKRYAREVGGAYVTHYPAFGHPVLEALPAPSSQIESSDGTIIYAPHFSIAYGSMIPKFRVSTFLINGQQILDFAKSHTEMKWVFKPHPGLKYALVASGAMSASEVEAYYGEWERIGETCYGGPEDYSRLFAASRVLVTDCGSFLTEYGLTGKPIIRLIEPNLHISQYPCLQKLFDLYYNVHNLDEMRQTFDEVLVNRKDPRRAARLAAIDETGLLGGHASERIVRFLDKLIRVKG